VGDRVLGVVAAVMRSSLRKDVFLARTGGEEFAVILNGTSLDVTMEIAERIRRAVEATPLKNQKTGTDYGPITLSLGICMASDAESAEELYNKADVALYAAKNTGRNCFQVYKPELNQEFEKNWMLYKR
jgi:diguanylate cyclase